MECKKCGGTKYYKSGFIKGHQTNFGFGKHIVMILGSKLIQ